MRSVLVFSAVGVGLLLLGWSGRRVLQNEPETLRLGTNVWLGYEPLHAQAARGALSPRLAMVEFVSASQVVRAFENREIDAAGLTLDEALRLQATTHDVLAVAVLDYSNGNDGLVAAGRYARLEDLAGARVGVETTALGAQVLARALEEAGLAATAVEVVPLNVNQHEAAWDAGAVDALVTSEPVLTRVAAGGGRVLFTSREMPGEIVDLLVIRASLARRQPEQVRELLAAWSAALSWARAEPEAFALEASHRLRLSPAEVQRLASSLQVPPLDAGSAALAGSLRPSALRMAQFLRSRGVAQVSDEDALALLGGTAR